ncbi:unnamed protein product, partial [Prorocentrum cordatum]
RLLARRCPGARRGAAAAPRAPARWCGAPSWPGGRGQAERAPVGGGAGGRLLERSRSGLRPAARAPLAQGREAAAGCGRPAGRSDGGRPADNDAVVFVKPHACTPATSWSRALWRSVASRWFGPAPSPRPRSRAAASSTPTTPPSRAWASNHGLTGSRAGCRGGRQVPGRVRQGARGGPGRRGRVQRRNSMEALDVDPSELLSRCLAAGYEKLGSGLYCAKLEGRTGATAPEIYVLNGFYARMREKFTASGVVVHWFQVRFDEKELPWATFRQDRS